MRSLSAASTGVGRVVKTGGDGLGEGGLVVPETFRCMGGIRVGLCTAVVYLGAEVWSMAMGREVLTRKSLALENTFKMHFHGVQEPARSLLGEPGPPLDPFLVMVGPGRWVRFCCPQPKENQNKNHPATVMTQGVENLPAACFIQQMKECLLPPLLVPAWRKGC